MDAVELERASEGELRHYAELTCSYEELAVLLAEPGHVEPGRLAAARDRAVAAAAALTRVAALLAPQRLSGEPVDVAVQVLWRRSAALAARAAELNRELVTAARARQVGIVRRLVELRSGRQALAGYRPVARVAPTVGTTA